MTLQLDLNQQLTIYVGSFIYYQVGSDIWHGHIACFILLRGHCRCRCRADMAIFFLPDWDTEVGNRTRRTICYRYIYGNGEAMSQTISFCCLVETESIKNPCALKEIVVVDSTGLTDWRVPWPEVEWRREGGLADTPVSCGATVIPPTVNTTSYRVGYTATIYYY